MKKYGILPLLKENQIYTATLRIKDQEHSVTFTSRYSPLYSTVRIIRGDFKDLFADFNDDHINRLIHSNSLLVSDMTDIDEDEGPTYAIRQYVRYKTELDLATDIFVTLYTKNGSEDKQLADMRVSKETRMNGIKDILKLLEEKVDQWELEAVGAIHSPKGAVRAGTTPYPYSGRVAF